jgi:HAD superfamily hydrolase (TIGR01509 family)
MKTCRSRLRAAQHVLPAPVVKAVIFDLDGVVVDSHPLHRQAWRSFLLTLNREVSERELDYILDGRKRADILCHFLGPLSEAQLDGYGKRKDAFFQRRAADVRPISGISRFVTHLARRGIRLAVATSAGRGRTHSMLERLGLKPYFAAIVTADDVSCAKPDSLVYRVACHHLQTEPYEACAFEDSCSGVLAAKSAALRCIGVASSETTRKVLLNAGADFVIPDFNNLTLKKLETLLDSARIVKQ